MSAPAAPARPPRPWPATFRALRHRNYRLFFTGMLVSQTGTWMQQLAQGWLVYRLTGDNAAALGLVAFVNQLGAVAMAPFGGALADRFSPRRLAFLAQCGMALQSLLLALLTFSGWVGLPSILALSLAGGLLFGIDLPARQVLLLELVGREDLANAVALNASIFHGSRIVGPTLAGVVVHFFGEAWCFLLNGVTFTVLLTTLTSLRLAPFAAKEDRPAVLAQLRDGAQAVGRTPGILALFAAVALNAGCALAYIAVLPGFVKSVLHEDSQVLGLLSGASGVGACAGALVVASRPSTAGLGRLVFGGSMAFFVLAMVLANSPTLAVAAVVIVAVGFAMILSNSSCNALVQTLAPEGFRGRTMSLYSMTFNLALAAGSLTAGLLAESIGIPLALTLLSAFGLAGMLWVRPHLPNRS